MPATVKGRMALLLLLLLTIKATNCLIFYPRGASLGYLAAVAMPLELPNRNVYMAFNFEANYGLPSNDSYNEWRDRWNLAQEYVGIGNNVTNVNNRRRRSREAIYTRNSFYRSVVGYLEHFGLNGTACLLRTICEVSASDLDVQNGLLGSLFKILFMPTTSAAEVAHSLPNVNAFAAEWQGRSGDCSLYQRWCPRGLLSIISKWY